MVVFAPFLKRFTMNEYTLKDSSEFTKDKINQNSNCFIASLDENSLFTQSLLMKLLKFVLMSCLNLKSRCVD